MLKRNHLRKCSGNLFRNRIYFNNQLIVTKNTKRLKYFNRKKDFGIIAYNPVWFVKINGSSITESFLEKIISQLVLWTFSFWEKIIFPRAYLLKHKIRRPWRMFQNSLPLVFLARLWMGHLKLLSSFFWNLLRGYNGVNVRDIYWHQTRIVKS